MANYEALTAVLRRVQRKRFDRTVILGDLVGYGADPNRTVEKVRQLRNAIIILSWSASLMVLAI